MIDTTCYLCHVTDNLKLVWYIEEGLACTKRNNWVNSAIKGQCTNHIVLYNVSLLLAFVWPRNC